MTSNFKILFFFVFIALTGCSSSLFLNNGDKNDFREVAKKVNSETVYFIDYEKKGSVDSIKKLKPNDIARIDAYFDKDKSAPRLFKKYTEYGVVLFITKKYAINLYRPQLAKISKDYYEYTKDKPVDEDNLLYVVNGEVLKPNVEGKLIDLKFSKIKRIELLSSEEAQKIYGDKAQYGAVIINSKKK